jgi:hypothetical protein
VQLTLNKRGYVPGEPIQGEVTISNGSDKSVKYANFHLMQRTVCMSLRPEVQVHESFFETPGMAMPADKLPAGQSLSYPIRFYVPALVPGISIPSCIETSLFACLDVGLIRGSPKSAFLTLKTPIFVGTHPAGMGVLEELTNKPSDALLKHRIPTAPPSYDQGGTRESDTTSMLDLPPSYASSVCGLSDISENASAVQNDNYSPVCYHYNFGEMDKKSQ